MERSAIAPFLQTLEQTKRRMSVLIRQSFTVYIASMVIDWMTEVNTVKPSKVQF